MPGTEHRGWPGAHHSTGSRSLGAAAVLGGRPASSRVGHRGEPDSDSGGSLQGEGPGWTRTRFGFFESLTKDSLVTLASRVGPRRLHFTGTPGPGLDAEAAAAGGHRDGPTVTPVTVPMRRLSRRGEP